MKSPTSSRKEQHVRITLSNDVSFKGKSSGFERLDFVHNALPELDLDEVDPSSTFLGKSVKLPIIVSSMTGGYRDAVRINRGLAEVCAECGLAMGVGSQRQAIEDSRHHRSYSVVREAAPSIPVFGNIGAAEVAKLRTSDPVRRLADLIGADGFAVHLNPLQEFLQPEGSPRFRGVLRGIEMLVKELAIPVIVKEIGAGISADVAQRLIDAGVKIIDVAGAGGTSWAGVEILRRNGTRRRKEPGGDFSAPFWDWGISTADALREVCALRSRQTALTVIASGGVGSGLDVAKSIALGADLAAAARPMLKTLEQGGTKGLLAEVDAWARQLRGAMFLTGSRTIKDLQTKQLVLRS